MNAKNRTRQFCANMKPNRSREALLYNLSHDSAWPWQWRANNKFWQNRVSLKGMYAWGVKSTVTKHSDYIVWKDTSERVAWRFDDTIDKKRVNFLCTKTPLFWRELSDQKIITKLRECFLNAMLMSRFENPAFWNCEARSFNQFINQFINSGSKVLRCCSSLF